MGPRGFLFADPAPAEALRLTRGPRMDMTLPFPAQPPRGFQGFQELFVAPSSSSSLRVREGDGVAGTWPQESDSRRFAAVPGSRPLETCFSPGFPVL